MMLGLDRSVPGAGAGTGAMPGMPDAEDTDDPLMRMMMQMMGGESSDRDVSGAEMTCSNWTERKSDENS